MPADKFYVQRSNAHGEMWMTIGPMSRQAADREVWDWRRAGQDARILECGSVADGESFEQLLKSGKARVI